MDPKINIKSEINEENLSVITKQEHENHIWIEENKPILTNNYLLNKMLSQPLIKVEPNKSSPNLITNGNINNGELHHGKKEGNESATHSNFSCDVYGKQVISCTSFFRHQIFDSDDNLHECSECDKSFPTNSELVDHFRLHVAEKKFECPICQKKIKFTSTGAVKRHVDTHSIARPYVCDLCPKRFRVKQYLVGHLRTHTGEKPFQCNNCHQLFTRSSHLKVHKAMCDKEIKPFDCAICCKSFGSMEKLERHVKGHTQHKKFQCSICEKKFARQEHLNAHVRVHTGEKPFECNICKKCFAEKSALVRHLRIHLN